MALPQQRIVIDGVTYIATTRDINDIRQITAHLSAIVPEPIPEPEPDKKTTKKPK